MAQELNKQDDTWLIDTHAHLQDDRFSDDLDSILENAQIAGVQRIVNAGTCLSTSEKAYKIASTHSGCYCLAGVHPHDSKSFKDSDLIGIETLLAKPETLGVGEIGLDYHYDFSDRKTQRDVFAQLWSLASQLSCPAIIHVREAFEDFFDVTSALPAPTKVLMHCFSGNLEIAKKALDKGYHFSVGGPLTFKRAETVSEVFGYIPLSNIHLESDCPYLAPVPFRGKRNEPSLIRYTFFELAKIKKIQPELLKKSLMQNALCFFEKLR